MHTIENRLVQQLGQQIKTVSRETLSMGVDMDSRGLHWRLAKAIPPQQRLDFALAVYYFGGLYVLIDADRGFLCVELIAQKFARLEKARANESYSIGHAFAELYDALGYGYDTTLAFSLIEQADLKCPQGFLKGFSDSTRQSIESDVMRVIRGTETAGRGTVINNLRQFIDDHTTVRTVAKTKL